MTENQTPRQAALNGLPPEWRERLIERAAATGIQGEHDVGWLIIGSVINAWAAAAETGRIAGLIGQASRNIRSLNQQLPEQTAEAVIAAATEAGRTAAQHIHQAGQQARQHIATAGHEEHTRIREAINTGITDARKAAAADTQAARDQMTDKMAEDAAAAIRSEISQAKWRMTRYTLAVGATVAALLISIGYGTATFFGSQYPDKCFATKDGRVGCIYHPRLASYIRPNTN